jgi:PAS domain S-box-containing protein
MSMMCPESAELVTPPTERLADLLMLSHEPMFAWKLDGAIEFWNAGAERLYGFAPNEAVGHSSHSLLQTKHPIELAELRSQLRNKRYWAGELRHLCKDGRKVIVDSRMQLLGDNTVLEVNRDVTQFKALLATLQESEQRLRSVAAIVESSDDAIVSKNLDGVITSWNKGAERIFGYSAEEAIGQPITIVIPHDRLDEEPAFLTRIRRGGTYRPFRDHSSAEKWQPNRRFIICVACQKRGGQDCWGGKDRKRYYRAEAKSGTDCHFGSGSRAPK